VSLISIGMPLYNAEKYVAEALESLLKQTHTDFEIIISDNGSTDRTQEIVADFAEKDGRIKLFTQPENLGPLRNFQFVLHQAEGEYFLWRSYDDWSDDHYLERLSLALDKNKDAELAVARLVQDNGTRQRIAGHELDYDGFDGRLFTRMYLLKSSHASWMYGLFRRNAVKTAIDQVLDTYPHVWAWDYLVLFPFALKGTITTDYSTTFFQRETGISSSVFRPKTAAAQIRLAKDFYRFCLRQLKRCKIGFFQTLWMSVYLLKFTSSRTEKFSRTLRILLRLRKP
jgi:glycosyltransferase involved in cell wall biosynthesis